MIETGLPENAVAELRGVFSQHPEIRRVILYGSRAMRRYRAGSDIDLCIEGEALGLRELLAIATEIDDLLHPWKVDLSLLHTIESQDLLDHIRRVGVTFYSNPPD